MYLAQNTTESSATILTELTNSYSTVESYKAYYATHDLATTVAAIIHTGARWILAQLYSDTSLIGDGSSAIPIQHIVQLLMLYAVAYCHSETRLYRTRCESSKNSCDHDIVGCVQLSDESWSSRLSLWISERFRLMSGAFLSTTAQLLALASLSASTSWLSQDIYGSAVSILLAYHALETAKYTGVITKILGIKDELLKLFNKSSESDSEDEDSQDLVDDQSDNQGGDNDN